MTYAVYRVGLLPIFLSLLFISNVQSQNHALHFDGVDDYVTVPHDSLLNLVHGDFTIEAWVYSTGTVSETILSKGVGSGANSADVFIFQIQSQQLGLELSDGTTHEWGYGTTANLPTNQWIHVAVTYDFDLNTAIFYVDGVPDGTHAYSITPSDNADTQPLFIAKQGHGCNCNYFDGKIDELRIWNVARSETEINSDIFSSLTSGTGLLASYDFNNGVAESDNTGITTLSDITGGGRDGALINFALSGTTSNWVTSDYDQIPAGDENALSFDGNDYVQITNSASINPDTTDYTIEFWFKYNGTPTLNSFLLAQYGMGSAGADNDVIQAYVDPSGILRFGMRDSGGLEDNVISPRPVTDSSWHHIAAVRDINKTLLILYLDGQIVDKVDLTATGDISFFGGNSLYLGARESAESGFEGYASFEMEELRIWKEARSQLQLRDLMFQEIPNPELEENLGLYYTFDQTSGGPLDGTSNFNDGIFGGDPIYQPSTGFVPFARPASATSAGGFEARWLPIANATNLTIDIDDNADFSSPFATNIAVGDPLDSSFFVNQDLSGFLNQKIYYRINYEDGIFVSPPSAGQSFMVQPGNALSFDGLDDYVSAPADESLDIAGDATLEFWINWQDNSSMIQTIIDKTELSNQAHYRVSLYGVASEGMENQLTIWNGTEEYISSLKVPVNVWTHVALVQSGSDMYFYNNGELVDSTSFTWGSPNNGALLLGTANSNGGLTSEVFAGFMDEVRIWNVARTGTELQSTLEAELSGAESGLLAYYKFDEEVTTTGLPDLSGNFNDGTLTNMSGTEWVPSDALAIPVEVSISTNGVYSPTSSLVSVQIAFSEEVVGFTNTDIYVANGTVSNLATADNIVFTADVFPSEGEVSIAIPSASAQGLDGTDNLTSDTLTWNHLPLGVAQYEVNSTVFGYETMISPTSITTGASTDDGTSGPIAIGFDFEFFDQTYNEVYLASNGYISFITNTASTEPELLPSNSSDNAVIAAYWSDLDPGASSAAPNAIEVDTIGTSPNQIFVIQYSDIPNFGDTDNMVNFQIKLFETTNEIEIHCQSCKSSEGFVYTQGIENEAGTKGLTILGRNKASFELTNDAVSFKPALWPTQAYQATNISAGGFTANWAPIADATGVYVDIDDNGDFSSPIATNIAVTDPLDDHFYVNQNLSGYPNQKLFYRISYETTEGTSEPSDTISFMLRPGNALDFTAASQHVVTTSSNLPISGAAPRTIELWLKADVTSGDSYALANGSSSSGNLFAIHINNGNLNVDGFGVDFLTGYALDTNWHHVAFAYDGTTIYGYVDGEATPTASAAMALNTTLSPLNLAGMAGDTTLHFDGQIDEVRVWSTYKTQTQIKEFIYAEISGSESGLEAYYRFDETTGLNLPDLSGNGLDGSLTNMAGTEWTASNALTPPGNLVVNTNNSGPGSLRSAIAYANANPGTTVSFDIAAAAPWAINVTSPLPQITANKTILDATTQPGWTGTAPISIKNGASVTTGFDIAGDSTQIYGFDIDGFTSYGIFVNASGVQIGDANKGNTVRNGGDMGIGQSGGTGLILKGNIIGLAPDGVTAQANANVGVGFYGSATTGHIVGGTGVGEGNVISGNGGSGIFSRAQITVLGNFIGTDATGTQAKPNDSGGLSFQTVGAAGSVIGDGTAGGRNLISGNNASGISAGAAVTIDNNFIGTDVNGTAAIPNSSGGISVGSTGGTSTISNNLISGNSASGISAGAAVTIDNNFIGTDVNGTAAIPNSSGGISVGVAGSTISNNLISGNGGNILLDASATLTNNLIGTDSSGTADLNNGSTGIYIRNGGNYTLSNNTIAYHSTYGVYVASGTGTDFSQNSFFCNGLPISNNAGINGDQPAPVIGTATIAGSITGDCPGCAVGDVIEIFRDSTGCTPAQATEYLGSATYSSGWSISGLSLNAGDLITATSTNTTNGTSEFSTAATVLSPPAAPTDLVVYSSSSTAVTLEWMDNATDEIGYDIEIADGYNGSFVNVATLGGDATTYTHDFGVAGADAFFRVIATNGAEDSTSQSSVEFGSAEPFPAYALSFDNVDDEVVFAEPVLNTVSDFTIEYWAKVPSTTSGQINYFQQQDSTGGGTPQVVLTGVLDGNLYFYVRESNSGVVAFTTGSALINDDQWHHFAYVRSGSTFSVYVDGTLDASTGSTITDPITFPDDAQASLQGDAVLDDFRVWNFAKTDFGDRYSFLTGQELDLLGYYPFDENGGTITVDRSIYTNDGTINGGAVYVVSEAATVLKEEFETMSTFSNLLSLPSGDYHAANGLVENTIVNSGSTALRLTPALGTITTPQIDGNADFSFYYAASGPGVASFTVEKSIDGAPYVLVANPSATSTTFSEYQVTLTEGGGSSARMRITLEDSISDQDLILDDISFSVYKGDSIYSPLLSNLSVEPYATSIDASITVDLESNLYYVVTQSNIAPSPPQVMAGQDENGNPAYNYYNYPAITGTSNFGIGTGANGASDTSLMSGTTYYIYWIAEETANSGNVSEVSTTTFTTALPSTVTLTTLATTGGGLQPNTVDNLIYKFRLDVADADALIQGFYFTPDGTHVQGDFTQFNFYQSINVDDFGSADFLGSDGFFLSHPSGLPDGSIGWLYDSTYTVGSSVYIYVTADMSASATDGGTFSLLTPTVENFGFDGDPIKNDGGLAAGPAFTVEAPEIDLEYQAESLADGSSLDLGVIMDGESPVLNFAIKNTGQANLDLTGSPFITNANSTDFLVDESSTGSPVNASGETIFSIQPTPSITGVVSTTLQIPNNDYDESPYDLTLSLFNYPNQPDAATALNFDGIDDAVTIPSVGNEFETAALTVEVWANYSAGDILIASENNNGWAFFFSGGNLAVSNVGNSAQVSTISAEAGWHHYAFTYDGSTVRFYLDGSYVEQYSYSLFSTSADGDYSIGARASLGQYFSGEIDEVRIWNYVRSDIEIANYVATSLNPAETGLTAYYRFDENMGGTLYDLANEHHGTILDLIVGNGDGDTPPGWSASNALSDLQAPSGYSLTNIGVDNMNDELSFDISGGEIGATYDYSISDGINTPVTGTGIIGADPESLTSILISSLEYGTLTIDVFLTDEAGNIGNTISETTQYNPPDVTAPTVVSIVRFGGVSEQTNNLAIFTVAFDEPVQNVDVSDFKLDTLGGSASGTISNVSVVVDSDNKGYDVQVNSLSGDGPLNLIFDPSQDISDLSGNLFDGVTIGSAEGYIVDTTPPSIATIQRFSPSSELTNEDPVTFYVTFSENVLSVDATDFVLTGEVSGTVSGVSPMNNLEYQVSISSLVGDGVLSIGASGSAYIEDYVGNTFEGTVNASESYIIDQTAPVVTFDESGQTISTTIIGGSVDDPSAFIYVSIDGGSTFEAGMNNGDGTWTYDMSSDINYIGNSTYSVVVDAEDEALNVGSTSGSVTIGISEPVITFDESGQTINSTIIGGTVDDVSATIYVSIDGGSSFEFGTNNGDGTWMYDMSSDINYIGDGGYSVVIDAESVDLNVGSISGSVIIDQTIPTITGTTSVSIAENTTSVGTYSANETVSWSLSGADASFFSISGGTVSFVSAPDYETALDQNTDNVYEVVVEGTDGTGNVGSLSVSVTVTDVDEVSPTISGTVSVSIAENATSVGTYSANETVSWSLSGADASFFNISGGTVSFVSTPDYETALDLNTDNVYEVIVEGTDGTGNVGSLAVSVTVTDVDEVSPTISGNVSVSIEENVTSVGTYSANEAVSWSLSGADASFFNISGGTVSFVSAPDYETALDLNTDNVYEVVVEGTDGTGNVGSLSVSVTVTDVDEVSPTVAITSSLDNPTMDNPFAVQITFSEPVSGFDLADISVENGIASELSGSGTSYSATIVPAADGEVSISISAGSVNDAAGNSNLASSEYVIVFDGTAPAVTVDALLTNNQQPALSGTVDDNEATISVKVGGGTYTATNDGDGTWSLSQGTIAILAEGVYDVEALATDVLGNSATDSSVDELTVDITAPTVTITALETLDDTPALTGTIDDTEAEISLTLQGETYSPTISGSVWSLANNTVTSLAVGTYDISVTATDKAGNSRSDNTTDELIILPGSPEAVVASAVNYFDFTAKWLARSGVESYELDVASDASFSNLISGFASKSTTATSLKITGLEYGTYYYYRVRAVYPSGDVSPSSNVIEVKTLLDPATVADSLALLTIYEATGGTEWISSNWQNGEKLADWDGVTMTGTRVTGLDLSSNNLTGIFPAVSSGLEMLTNLDISNNKLVALSDLSDMQSITSLDVKNNHLQFGSLELNMGVAGISYMPQDSVGVYLETLEQQGSTYIINREISGSNNSYTWYKQDLLGNVSQLSGSDPEYSLPITDFSDEGSYFAKVTSSVVTGIELTTQSVVVKVSSLERDSTALMNIYQSMNGVTWTSNAKNWADQNLKDWFGVTIANERISQLSLSGNNMVGKLPKDILDIAGLTSIDLSGNKISDVPDFSSLGNLNTLNLSSNALDFGDLEKNMDLTGVDLSYSGQALIGTALNDTISKGEDYQLKLSTPGTANRYQWKLKNDVKDGNVSGATNSTYTIEAIDFNNMGRYSVLVTNDLVPGLSLTSRTQQVWASASMDFIGIGQGGEAITDGLGYALKDMGEKKPFDSAAVISAVDGKFAFELVLGDYLIAIEGNRDLYLPTYYKNTFLWEEASKLPLRDHRVDTLFMTNVPGLLPEDPEAGVVKGFVESDLPDDEENSEGRVQARRKVKKAGCSMRRRTRGGGGRTEEDIWELMAYVETNDDGEFEFGNLPDGTYRFNIEYPGIPMDPNSFVEFEIGKDGILGNEFTLEAYVTENGIEVIKVNELGFFRKYFKDLNVYPNPANDVLTISYQKLVADNVYLQLMDMTGTSILEQEVKRGFGQKVELDVSNLADGVYLLNFYDPASKEKQIIGYKIFVRHK